jgi:hypothetical protein
MKNQILHAHFSWIGTLLGGAAILLTAPSAHAEKMTGLGTDIGVGANGSVFLIGTSPCNGNGCTVYEHESNSWKAYPGSAVRVAVDRDGKPWVVNGSNELYRFSNGSFQQVNARASDVGVGADGSVFIIGVDNCNASGCQVYQVKEGQTVPYPGTAVRIAVGPSGEPWVVNRGGEIFRWEQGSFKKQTGLATDIGVASNGTPYVIGTGPCDDSGCTVYKLDGGSWKPLSATAVQVSAGSEVWAVNLKNEIFRLESSAPKMDLKAPRTSLRLNHSGQCFDLPAGDDRSGTRVIQNACYPVASSQLWVERFVSGPWALLVNGRSGMCMEVENPSTPGSPVVQRPCNPNLKQQWFHVRPEKTGDQNTLVTKSTEFCVGVPGAASNSGAGISQENCSGGNSQRIARLTPQAVAESRAHDTLATIARDALGIEDPDPEICWMRTTTRGVGTLANTCSDPTYPERDGMLLCYEKCKPGYSNTTVFTCGQTCPAGWGDEPATCRKPGSYSVSGYPLAIYEFWKSLDTLHKEAKAWCEASSGTACEWRHLLYYPICKAGFAPEPAAAMVCSPRCPAGMTDSGFGSCWKHSYIKGSIPTNCPAGQMRDPHDPVGLCYPACPAGSTPVGPVCWQTCKGTYGTFCGAACAKSASACAFSIIEQVESTAMAALNIASLIGTGGAATPLLQAGKLAAKSVGKRSLTAAERQLMKQQIKSHLDDATKILTPSQRDIYVSLGQEGVDNSTNLAELLVKAYEDGEFDWHSLIPTAADLDPTGFLSIVRAFNKPVCQ